MYSYSFDLKSGGIVLNSSPTIFSKEPRPVWADELDLLGFDRYWNYEKQNDVPFMWAESNVYWYRGIQIAKTKGGDLYNAPELLPVRSEDGSIPFSKIDGYTLQPIDMEAMSMHTDITYVELPTITSINRGFYEKWPGTQKFKESHLDEIKHKLEGGYFYTPGQAPIHLVSELKVVENAIDFAATELAMHKCKSFIIASDHGASRLAVLHHQEEKYETDTKGEHSGRCCKEFPDADLPNAIRENGYFVLSDYGRFKNSRAANVEVHGGATLEEVVVPVIRLSLRKQDDVVIKLLNADAI